MADVVQLHDSRPCRVVVLDQNGREIMNCALMSASGQDVEASLCPAQAEFPRVLAALREAERLLDPRP